MNDSQQQQNWTDRLLDKLGGDKQGKKEFKLSMINAAIVIAWAGLAAISDYTVERELIAEVWIWPMVLAPIITAPVVFYSYYLFFSGADELAQRLQANALCLAFALSVFAVVTFISLANVGYEEPGANEMFAIMAVSYAISCAIMAWRYYR